MISTPRQWNRIKQQILGAIEVLNDDDAADMLRRCLAVVEDGKAK